MPALHRGKSSSCPAMGRILLSNPKSRFLHEGSHGNWAAKIKYLKIWKRCWCARQMQELWGKRHLPAPSTWPGRGPHRCPVALPLPPHLARLPQAGSSCPAHLPAHHIACPQPPWDISPPLHKIFCNRNCRARGWPLSAIASVAASAP